MDSQLVQDLENFANELKQQEEFLVVSHHDADGITACAIMVDLFRFLNKKVNFLILKQLDSVTIDQIEEVLSDQNNPTLVFTDMGSGQLSLLEEKGISNFFVIDHHPPEKKYERQINPHFYDYDGGWQVCGAGMAYLVARTLGRKKMAYLAVVGAVGDMQDWEGKLHYLNREILNDAIENNTIEVENDLRLFGRQSRPLSRMLAYSSDPIIPGLTGNPQACKHFLESLGVELKRDDDSWRSYIDLNEKEKKKIISAIYMKLLDCNTPEEVIQSMIGEVYTLVQEEKRTELRDSQEFSTLLNACGRQKKAEIGVKVCLGNRGKFWQKAQVLLRRHRRELREGINLVKDNGLREMDNLYYFDSQGLIKESIIGIVAGMAYGARIVPPDKPILALAQDKKDPKRLKISSRANSNLVRKGIDLGKAMNQASTEVGGEGGGHDIAAGARIPQTKKEEFLEKVNQIFEDSF